MRNIIKRPQVDKKHQRHIENVDFYNAIVKQQIAEKRSDLTVELDAAEYFDDIQKKTALEIFDRLMEDTLDRLELQKVSSAKITKRFNEAFSVFWRKILPQLHRFAVSIKESQLSATFGGSLEDGHVVTEEWNDSVQSMLAKDKSKFSNKTYLDQILTYVPGGFYGIAIGGYATSLIAGHFQLVPLVAAVAGLSVSFISAKWNPIRYGHYISSYVSFLHINYRSFIREEEYRKREEERKREREEFEAKLAREREEREREYQEHLKSLEKLRKTSKALQDTSLSSDPATN